MLYKFTTSLIYIVHVTFTIIISRWKEPVLFSFALSPGRVLQVVTGTVHITVLIQGVARHFRWSGATYLWCFASLWIDKKSLPTWLRTFCDISVYIYICFGGFNILHIKYKELRFFKECVIVHLDHLNCTISPPEIAIAALETKRGNG